VYEMGAAGTPPEPISTIAAAKRIGCSRRQVNDLINEKKLAAHRAGGRTWAVDPASVEALIEQGRNRKPDRPALPFPSTRQRGRSGNVGGRFVLRPPP
jgi:excisionase family DNA binding protein